MVQSLEKALLTENCVSEELYHASLLHQGGKHTFALNGQGASQHLWIELSTIWDRSNHVPLIVSMTGLKRQDSAPKVALIRSTDLPPLLG